MRVPTRPAAVVAAGLVAALGAGVASPATAADRPRHNLKVDAKELDSANRFLLYGKVITYPEGRIKLKRSVAGRAYEKLDTVKTSHNGRFRTRIYQVGDKLTCFKVVIPSTPDYRRTVSKGELCISS